MTRMFFLSFFSFFILFESSAQPLDELKDYQEKFPGIGAIILNEKVELHFEIKDGELFIYEDKYEETFFLSEIASYWKEEELAYSTFNELSNINASTLIPRSKKYKEIKVTEFKDKDELSSSIFHDDTKITTFSYEGLQKGAKTILSYRNTYKDEHLIGKEFLQSYIPIIHKSYSIIADERIEIAYSTFNLDQANVVFSEKSEDGKNTYSWEVNNVKELESESWSPGISWYSPHIVPYIKSYTIDGIRKNVFRDTEDLFKWYNEIISGVNSDLNNPEIQALVDSITANAVDELDKVRKVFYWTQDNIKYIAIEYGMGGFVPREVDYICENRYGDCKDMASTITSLLQYAGIESYLTWIGTNKIPYKYAEIPTPVVDNHMIATYIDKDGKYYFLDATGRYYPFGIPSSFIQGKEALIRKGEDSFEVVEVPHVEAKDNMISEKVFLKMDGDNILGNSITQISGYQKANFEYQVENLNKDEKLQFYKSFFSKGSNKFIPANFSEENMYPIEHPLKVKYDFTIDNYVMENGEERYINMNLENTVLGQKIEEEREIPIQNKYAIGYENENTLEIPAGWSVDYVPEDLSIENEFIQYNSKYEINENQLILHQYTRITFLNMEKDHFDLWNKNVGEIKRNQNEIVILKQNHD